MSNMEIIQRDYDGDDDRWLVVVEARFDPVSATETRIDGASFLKKELGKLIFKMGH